MKNHTKNIRETPYGKLVKLPLQRIHLELTNICDFDCVFCPKSIMTRKYGSIDKDLAFKVIDEIAEQKMAEKLTFHVMGEPLMYRHIFDILNRCRERGLKAGITTTGSLLKEDVIPRLVDAGIHQINISLQTPDANSFALRKAGSLGYNQYAERVVGYLNELKKRKGDTIVKIHFLNTRHGSSIEKDGQKIEIINNTPSLRSALSEWVEKVYSIEGMEAPNGEKERVLEGVDKVSINKWNVLEVAPRIFFETYILNSWGNAFSKDNISEASFGYCPGLQDHFAILYSGDLVYCCRDFDGKTAVGNVRDHSLVELLNSEQVLNSTRGFQRFRVIHSYCKKCLGGKSPSAALLNQLGSIAFLKLFKWYFYNTQKLHSLPTAPNESP